uniref:Uncharacterized protein n=1 Tax=Macaca mulatta TaxID=9544 RepID=A0A5F8AKZ3_MACMU
SPGSVSGTRLSQLKEKLREGRDASRALNQHLQALLTPDEPATSQGRDLREQLAEGCRLAQHLVRKLTPENGEDEDEDVNVEETEKVQESRAPREVQKAERRKNLRTHWRNIPSLVQIATVLVSPTSLTATPKSHLRKTKSTHISLTHPLMMNGRMLYPLSQKMKVIMKKRKKKGQCLPGICRSLKRRKLSRNPGMKVIRLPQFLLTCLPHTSLTAAPFTH